MLLSGWNLSPRHSWRPSLLTSTGNCFVGGLPQKTLHPPWLPARTAVLRLLITNRSTTVPSTVPAGCGRRDKPFLVCAEQGLVNKIANWFWTWTAVPVLLGQPGESRLVENDADSGQCRFPGDWKRFQLSLQGRFVLQGCRFSPELRLTKRASKVINDKHESSGTRSNRLALALCRSGAAWAQDDKPRPDANVKRPKHCKGRRTNLRLDPFPDSNLQPGHSDAEIRVRAK